MNKKEIWKSYELAGCCSELQVSSRGRVKCVSYIGGLGWHGGKCKKSKNKVLKTCGNGNGYRYVTVTVDGKRKHLYVHRIVAELFIENPEGKPYVNHIDYDRTNNSVENLEWCTPSENNMHSAGRMAHPKQNAKTGVYGKGICKKKGKYEVSIYHGRKQYYIGRFETVIAAQSARNEKYKELGMLEYV